MKLDKVVADVRRQLPFSILNGSNGNETKRFGSCILRWSMTFSILNGSNGNETSRSYCSLCSALNLSVSSTDRMAMKRLMQHFQPEG